MIDLGLEESNRLFLASSMRWLRLLLEERAAPAMPAREASTTPERLVAIPDKPKDTAEAVPDTPRDTTEAAPDDPRDTAEAARASMMRAAELETAPSFAHLTNRFALSPFERDVLLLAIAMEIDTGIADRIALLNGDANKRYPTFALAMSLFGNPTWDALSPARPLRRERLLEVHQTGAQSLLCAPLRVDERIAAFAKGLNYLDERLVPAATVAEDVEPLPASQEAVARTLYRWLVREDASGIAQLTGSHGASKVDIVARAATLGGRKAILIPADSVPAASDELENFLRLWSREAQLLPIALLFQDVEGVAPLAGEDGRPRLRQAPWSRVARDILAPCILDVKELLPGVASNVSLRAAPPTDSERRELWFRELTLDDKAPDEIDVIRLAGEFKNSAAQLRAAAAQARDAVEGIRLNIQEDGNLNDEQGNSLNAEERPAKVLAHAWSQCVERAGSELAAITRWIQPAATLTDVKLPATEKSQLERLVHHARFRSIVSSEFGFGERGRRGLGLAALFHGESGTGKTLAAEAVAGSLGLGLAVVDLATIKSKYIGETEKNLRRIFDAAEAGGAVLFWDEADALFSKRRETKDGLDYYANVEINYLLTRMENFDGISILATNMKHALDPAFMRRLRFVVSFPFPSSAERRQIWESVFPERTPVRGLDYDHLSRFALSGGSIFNIAVAAAHSAAADGSWLEMSHVLDALRWEMRKLERPISDTELRTTAARSAAATARAKSAAIGPKAAT